MRVALLGSGSAGNATLVRCGNTRILIDAGFSARDIARRLDMLHVEPGQLAGIVITHDHGDHTRGMGVFARRHGTPLYMTERTHGACAKLLRGEEDVRTYRAGYPILIGDAHVEPFLTVHDAADPVGVAVIDECTGIRLGVATDLGRPTAQIRHALSGCDLLILEANHDEMLLQTGPYPRSVKQRIASSHGHLSNQAAASFVVELLHPRLAGVVLAHLSSECNRPELALKVIGNALDKAGWSGYLAVADQDLPSDWMDVEQLRLRCGPRQLSFL